ncbi:MAG: PIN domain nuclease [Gammaproteobacteria bacterium]|nr:MAG: PIN domain nuclease [Gammaproteobacteria bacterium]
MRVLVDSSVWIDYFKNDNKSHKLDSMLEDKKIVICDVILAELVPFLEIKKQRQVINLLYEIDKLLLHINWQQIMKMQLTALQNGINGIGILDLIIAQNALQNNCSIYSFDKHFKFIGEIFDLKTIEIV